MKVFVRNAVSGGSSQGFEVKASQRVHDLQGLVGLPDLRPAGHVRLLRGDEILEEWQSLEAAGVSDGAELSYVVLNVEPDLELEEMVARMMDEHGEDDLSTFDIIPSVLDLEAKCGASFPDSLKTYLKFTNVIMHVGKIFVVRFARRQAVSCTSGMMVGTSGSMILRTRNGGSSTSTTHLGRVRPPSGMDMESRIRSPLTSGWATTSAASLPPTLRISSAGSSRPVAFGHVDVKMLELQKTTSPVGPIGSGSGRSRSGTIEVQFGFEVVPSLLPCSCSRQSCWGTRGRNYRVSTGGEHASPMPPESAVVHLDGLQT